MRLFITGGSGYFGQHLVPVATQSHQIAYTYWSQDRLDLPNGIKMDMRSADSVRQTIDTFQPDVIIHLAGTNRSADMENATIAGATNITAAAQQQGTRLIFFSTDVVFDGTQAPYRESDPTTPIHAYGRAKVQAEQIVAQHSNHVIVRTSLIYSLHSLDWSTRWAQAALARGESITLFTDHWRNPIFADDLVAACLELAENEFVGILHVAGSEAVTRADFGRKLLTHWHIPITEHVNLGPDTTGKFPKDCRLDTTLAQRVLNTRLRGVDEILRL